MFWQLSNSRHYSGIRWGLIKEMELRMAQSKGFITGITPYSLIGAVQKSTLTLVMWIQFLWIRKTKGREEKPKLNWGEWGEVGTCRDQLESTGINCKTYLSPLTTLMTRVTCNGTNVLCHRAIHTHTPNLQLIEMENIRSRGSWRSWRSASPAVSPVSRQSCQPWDARAAVPYTLRM